MVSYKNSLGPQQITVKIWVWKPPSALDSRLSGLWANPEYLRIFSLCTGGAYYVPYSCLLISNKFCNGRERPEQGEKVPLCTCSSTPLSTGPETSLVVHKTTYAPMIYTALCIMFWMRANSLRGLVGGGWALEFESFLGPVKWHQADRRVPFGLEPKTLCTGVSHQWCDLFYRLMHSYTRHEERWWEEKETLHQVHRIEAMLT
jgi:hypothetical protein